MAFRENLSLFYSAGGNLGGFLQLSPQLVAGGIRGIWYAVRVDGSASTVNKVLLNEAGVVSGLFSFPRSIAVMRS